jgi:hypothetical protein
MKWNVVNRYNDIKIASFDTQIEANVYANHRNSLAHVIGNPWFVSQV